MDMRQPFTRPKLCDVVHLLPPTTTTGPSLTLLPPQRPFFIGDGPDLAACANLASPMIPPSRSPPITTYTHTTLKVHTHTSQTLDIIIRYYYGTVCDQATGPMDPHGSCSVGRPGVVAVHVSRYVHVCTLPFGNIADCSFAGSITTSIPFATYNRYDNSRPQIPLRLLPLGDSTTKGGMFDGENSYRPALRNLLIGSGRYLFCASRRVWLPDSLTLAPQVAQSITLAT